MPFYPDKRQRYRGAHPADFAAGIARFDNPTPTGNARIELAQRSAVPRDSFRVTTDPENPENKPPEPVAPPPPPKPWNAVPEQTEV